MKMTLLLPLLLIVCGMFLQPVSADAVFIRPNATRCVRGWSKYRKASFPYALRDEWRVKVGLIAVTRHASHTYIYIGLRRFSVVWRLSSYTATMRVVCNERGFV